MARRYVTSLKKFTMMGWLEFTMILHLKDLKEYASFIRKDVMYAQLAEMVPMSNA